MCRALGSVHTYCTPADTTDNAHPTSVRRLCTLERKTAQGVADNMAPIERSVGHARCAHSPNAQRRLAAIRSRFVSFIAWPTVGTRIHFMVAAEKHCLKCIINHVCAYCAHPSTRTCANVMPRRRRYFVMHHIPDAVAVVYSRPWSAVRIHCRTSSVPVCRRPATTVYTSMHVPLCDSSSALLNTVNRDDPLSSCWVGGRGVHPFWPPHKFSNDRQCARSSVP